MNADKISNNTHKLT